MINEFVKLFLRFAYRSFVPKIMGRFLFTQGRQKIQNQIQAERKRRYQQLLRKQAHKHFLYGILNARYPNNHKNYNNNDSEVHTIHIHHEDQNQSYISDIDTVLSENISEYADDSYFEDDRSVVGNNYSFIQMNQSFAEDV